MNQRVDHSTLGALIAAIPAALGPLDPWDNLHGTVPRRPLNTDTAGECAWLLTVIADAGAPLASSAGITRAANALLHSDVREVMFAVADTSLQDAAEQVWLRLARVLRGEAQAAAATFLAHLQMLRGEWTNAAVYVGVALTAEPDFMLAQLLGSLLQQESRAALAAKLAADSRGKAFDVGVLLPARLAAVA